MATGLDLTQAPSSSSHTIRAGAHCRHQGTALRHGVIVERALQELLHQLTSMRPEMSELRREIAQFSAMRNSLITKLDDAVTKAQEAIAAGGARTVGGSDPLGEARRDRHMGVVKSMLSEILESLSDT